jgi:hypothetical protein
MNGFPITGAQLAARLKPQLEKAAPPSMRTASGELHLAFEIGWLQGELADALNLLAAAPPLESEPLERTRQRLLARFQPQPEDAAR